MTSKTITLAGAEIRADYSGGTNAWLRNDGTATVYASTAPGAAAGADGVVSIPAGQAAAIYGACGTVYLLGTGSVQLVGSDYTACPFKTSAQSGGSGADEVARAAVEAHAGNADIHVTAAQKAAWDGKADLSDIPDKLPADGGNAATVNGTRVTPVGVAKGYTSSNVADVITYGDRVVRKQSTDSSYIGWAITSDGWFTPIFVSRTVEGTRYIMNGYECGYSAGGARCNSFTYNGETYYACWNNSASLMYPTVTTSALYVALSADDYISACKKLIDTCEGTYANGGNAETLDGLHESSFAQNIGVWSEGDIKDLLLNCTKSGFVFIHPGVTGMPNDNMYLFGLVDCNTSYKQLIVRDVNNSSAYCLCWNNGAQTWTVWKNIADGGSASSVGTYTEEKIAALEARIAALEGGN